MCSVVDRNFSMHCETVHYLCTVTPYFPPFPSLPQSHLHYKCLCPYLTHIHTKITQSSKIPYSPIHRSHICKSEAKFANVKLKITNQSFSQQTVRTNYAITYQDKAIASQVSSLESLYLIGSMKVNKSIINESNNNCIPGKQSDEEIQDKQRCK